MRRRKILVHIDLIQDIDILLPVILAINRDARLMAIITVSRWLEKASPRTLERLGRHGLTFRTVRRSRIIEGQAPGLIGIAALLTASDSSAEAHRACHVLALRAKALGIPTLTLQHGIDGISQAEEAALRNPDQSLWASDYFLAWAPPESLPSSLPDAIRKTIVCVGRPFSGLEADDNDPVPRFDIGVFENLHWDRYSDHDRADFLKSLLNMARDCPQSSIFVRSHPAGAWLDQYAPALAGFTNIIMMTAETSRRDPAPTAFWIARCQRVITTPSTIALDAAQLGRPVVLALPGCPLYDTIPVLESQEDWCTFARASSGDIKPDFVSRHVMAGNALVRILTCLAHSAGA